MTDINDVYSLLNDRDEPISKSEKKLIASLKPLVAELNDLAEQAVREYEPLINEIIHEKCTDKHRIEYIIDRILDICNHRKGLSIFCKLMRYYFTVDAKSAQAYIDIFLEWYDESAFDEDGFWERFNKNNGLK